MPRMSEEDKAQCGPAVHAPSSSVCAPSGPEPPTGKLQSRGGITLDNSPGCGVSCELESFCGLNDEQHDTAHTEAAEAKAQRLLEETAESAVRYRRGVSRPPDEVYSEIVALVESGAISGARITVLARQFLPGVASAIQESAAADPDPVVRANSRAKLECDEFRALVDQINRTGDTAHAEHADSRSLAGACDAESCSPAHPAPAEACGPPRPFGDPEQRAAELFDEWAELAVCYREGHDEAGEKVRRQVEALIESGAISRHRVAALADAYMEVVVARHKDRAAGDDPVARELSRIVLAGTADLVRAVERRKVRRSC
jgi:hypothetical protein